MIIITFLYVEIYVIMQVVTGEFSNHQGVEMRMTRAEQIHGSGSVFYLISVGLALAYLIQALGN